MLQVIFLGTSGSTPTKERSMPSFAIKHEGEVFLFDCGEGTQRQMMKYKVGYGKIKGVFISHTHLDHFIGLYGLIETLHLTMTFPKPMKIVAPKGFEKLLINKYKFMDVEEIKSGVVYKGKGFSISAFKVKHGRDTYGFVFEEEPKIKFNEKKAHSLGLEGKMFREIQEKGFVKVGKKKVKLKDVSWEEKGKKIVYSGDTLPCNEVVKAAKDADILIHETTLDDEWKKEAEERLHSTSTGAAKTAKKAKVKKLILTHLSPRYRDVSPILKQAKKVFPDVEIAKDGMVVNLR